MGNLWGWLIAQSSEGGTGTPPFHFFLPWAIFCGLALLVPFYYYQEGRKRFFGSHSLNKYLMDRFTNWLWPLGLVGFILMGLRFAEAGLFAMRIWRYAWLLWAVGIFGYAVYYLIFRYPANLRAYKRQRTLEQYIPQAKNKRRRAARA